MKRYTPFPISKIFTFAGVCYERFNFTFINWKRSLRHFSKSCLLSKKFGTPYVRGTNILRLWKFFLDEFFLFYFCGRESYCGGVKMIEII